MAGLAQKRRSTHVHMTAHVYSFNITLKDTGETYRGILINKGEVVGRFRLEQLNRAAYYNQFGENVTGKVKRHMYRLARSKDTDSIEIKITEHKPITRIIRNQMVRTFVEQGGLLESDAKQLAKAL